MRVEGRSQRVAVVAGAHGIVGRAIVAALVADGGWQVIGLSRRGGEGSERVRYQSLDLSDGNACAAAAKSWHAVTHLYYAALLPNADLAVETRDNAAMLGNLVTTLEPAAPHLAHIQIMQGSKWYGNHLGPYKTPAQEDDSRHGAPCFYYNQQDWLAARQLGKQWTWSALRPHGVLGFALGSSMNQLTAMALYATIMKARGEPLCWPGSEAAFDCVYQFTEASYLAAGAMWAATTPSAANQPFNFTNGDLVRWRHLWPAIAAAFGMEAGPPQPQSLAETMPQHEPLWSQVCRDNCLAPHSMSALTNWRFADFVFHCGYDQISDLTRVRNAGWFGVNPSASMYVRLIGDLRAQQIIP
jgi:nucleoside-diphosphate-sugar epimerase